MIFTQNVYFKQKISIKLQYKNHALHSKSFIAINITYSSNLSPKTIT